MADDDSKPSQEVPLTLEERRKHADSFGRWLSESKRLYNEGVAKQRRSRFRLVGATPEALPSDSKEDLDAADLEEEWVGQLVSTGEAVFSHHWNSGGPGAGADCERVYRRGDDYYVLTSYDGWSGPHA